MAALQPKWPSIHFPAEQSLHIGIGLMSALLDDPDSPL